METTLMVRMQSVAKSSVEVKYLTDILTAYSEKNFEKCNKLLTLLGF